MAIEYGDGSDSNAGRIVQVVSAAFTGVHTTANVSQGGESGIPFTASIAPKDNNNKIFVQCQISCDMSTTHASFATLKRQIGGGGYTEPFIGDASGNRHRVTSGMSDHNTDGDHSYNGRGASSIVLMEVAV